MKLLTIFFVAALSSISLGKNKLTEIDFTDAPEWKKEKPTNHRPFSWLCIDDVSSISVICSDLGINELEGPKAELGIFVTKDGVPHQFGLRHGIATLDCHSIKNRIKATIPKAKRACLRGANVEEEGPPRSVSWVFDEWRTESAVFCEFNGC